MLSFCFLRLPGLVAALSLVAAVGVTRAYWGYFLMRPSLPSRVVNASGIAAVSVVRSMPMAGGRSVLVAEDPAALHELASLSAKDPYDTPSGRALVALQDHLPAEPPPVSESVLKAVADWLASPARLDRGRDVYAATAQELRGAVLELRDREHSLVYVGCSTGQVSNDHYAFHEAVFEKADDGSLRPLEATRFYYDIAGLEHLEGVVLAAIFFVAGMILTTPVLAVVYVFRRARRGKAASAAEPRTWA
jgi:hypothetical protein